MSNYNERLMERAEEIADQQFGKPLEKCDEDEQDRAVALAAAVDEIEN